MELDISNVDIYKIKYVGGKWFALGETVNEMEETITKIIYSNDFSHWFETDINLDRSDHPDEIVYTENVYCLMVDRYTVVNTYNDNNSVDDEEYESSYYILASNDGIHWVDSELNNIRSIDGLSANSGVICCAYRPKPTYDNENPRIKIAISYDGIIWKNLIGYDDIVGYEFEYFECQRESLYIRTNIRGGDMITIQYSDMITANNTNAGNRINNSIQSIVDEYNTPSEEENDAQALRLLIDFGNPNGNNPEEDDYYDGYEEEDI